MNLAALPPGMLHTDPVGHTEPPRNDKLKLPPILWDCLFSAMLPADSPDISDGDREPVVDLELKIWLCLPVAAVVQLILLMLE